MIKSLLDRIPPRDKEAEILTMCCCLLDGRCVDKVSPDDFYGNESEFPVWLYRQVDKAYHDARGRTDHASLLFRRCMAVQPELKSRFGIDCVASLLGRIAVANAVVERIDEYLQRCREAKRYRERVTDLIIQLSQAYQEWDHYYRFIRETSRTR